MNILKQHHSIENFTREEKSVKLKCMVEFIKKQEKGERNNVSNEKLHTMKKKWKLFYDVWIKKRNGGDNVKKLSFSDDHSLVHTKKDSNYDIVEFHNISAVRSIKELNVTNNDYSPKQDNVPGRPVMLQNATKGRYKGQGIEISDLVDILEKSRQTSILSLYGSTATNSEGNEYHYSTLKSHHIHDSLSEYDLDSLFSNVTEDSTFDEEESRDEEIQNSHRLDDIYDDNYFILGTDEYLAWDARQQILSSPLMNSIRKHLPLSISEQNFWLRYSLVRDGASIYNLLNQTQGSSRTILAIETTDGEIFGSYTSNTWNVHQGFYGSGQSFLWRTKNTYPTNYDDLEIFPWTGKNHCIQFCSNNLIGLGGGKTSSERNSFGFGLALDNDLFYGLSDSCDTFDNPRLARFSSDGIFEIANIEIWTFTPCMTLEDAEKLQKSLYGIPQ